MPFLDTTDSSFLRSLGTSSAEYPKVSSLLRRGEVLSELAVSEAEKAMSVISGGTPRTDVPPEMQWLVVRATVTSVVALAAKITAHGMTLVVDAVCLDAMGGSYTLKDLPIGMARGHPYGDTSFRSPRTPRFGRSLPFSGPTWTSGPQNGQAADSPSWLRRTPPRGL